VTAGRHFPLVGVHPTATDLSMPVIDLAREATARGLRSLYLPEHTHVPVGSLQIKGDWRMAERYQRTLDPYIAAAFIAAATSLEVGTAISLVAQHDAIALAKAVATLDVLSGGRVVLGVGFGYNREEAASHGVPFGQRAVMVEETVRLMRALWTEDKAAYEGRFLRLPPSWSWPKPVRPGGPSVLLERELGELRARWADAGRDGEPGICCFLRPGPTDELAHQLTRGAELGIQRMQVLLEDRRRDEVLPVLDDLAAAVARL
jgi:alkanesulfonate monooxygenase SsuD/methylene tetrahydromethanopterin reductase-like flavin-dependent oxidoreductase (luciferase family)